MCENYSAADRTVANFGYLPEESLCALHASLSLDMSCAQLAACAAYYRSIGRDATVDELRLIDACLASARMRDQQHMALSTLTSPDESVAELLRSLVACCQPPKGAMPLLTLKHCLTTSAKNTPAIPLADAKTGASLHFVTDEQYGLLEMRGLVPVQSIQLGDTGLRLALTEPTKSFAATARIKGELIALLSCPDGASESYFAALRAFLNHESNRSCMKKLTVCSRGELLDTLLTLCRNGCYVDPSVLGVSDADARGYLIVSNEAGMRTMLDIAHTCKLSLIVFARATNDGLLTLAERDALRATVSLSLLHSLEEQRITSLQLSTHGSHGVEPTPLPSRLSRANTWEYVEQYTPGEPIKLGSYTVMHTALALHDALTPHDVTRAIMQCALELTAAGGDFDTLCAATALSVGPDCSPLAAWSAVLGAHGILNDWTIPSCAPIIRSTASGAGELTICLFAHTITPQATAAPTQLRLFAVTTGENGLPDAKAWRSMLSLTSRALANGQLAGLRPLWNRPLNEALTSVKDLTPDEPWTCREDVLQQAVFGLFVRAEATVKQGVLLGTMACADQATDEPNDTARIKTPARYSLVHRDRPTVLVPFVPAHSVPRTLLTYLRSLGADVRAIPLALTHESCTAFADALFGADIVLLCGDEQTWNTVLEHRRVRYALEQLLNARDGTLVALHGAARASALASLCEDAERLILCPDGVRRTQLEGAVAYYR